jgi:transcriptional regulator with XRE-family HTH domain
MTGPELLKAYLEKEELTARELCRRSEGRLNEPELSRYLSGSTMPSIPKAIAIKDVTKKAVPVESWAPKGDGGAKPRGDRAA